MRPDLHSLFTHPVADIGVPVSSNYCNLSPRLSLLDKSEVSAAPARLLLWGDGTPVAKCRRAADFLAVVMRSFRVLLWLSGPQGSADRQPPASLRRPGEHLEDCTVGWYEPEPPSLRTGAQ